MLFRSHGQINLESAAKSILNALPFAYMLPRFVAPEFAAAFIAGNKEPGNMQISNGPQHYDDLSHHYEIWQAVDKTLMIKIWEIKNPKTSVIYFGTLEKFLGEKKALQ